MIESNQFGSQVARAGVDAKACAQFEAMLADALDGLLAPEQQTTFDEHAKSCAGCGVQMSEAQRGAAWLSMLKAYPPEPDPGLVTRILAETSVRAAAEQEALRAQQRVDAEQGSLLGSSPRSAVVSPVAGAGPSAGGLSFRFRVASRLRPMTHAVLQPRFMMTAAMAFFSIALTLNVAGIRLSEIHASDLKPSSLRRSFYQANAHVVRYYDNLRVVYELESRVHDLQHSSDDSAPATTYPSATPDPQPGDSAPAGAKPRSGEPAGKTPDGTTSRPAPNPRSGSSRGVSPTQRLVQVADAGEDAWLDLPAPQPAAAWDARHIVGRAL